MDEEAEPEFNYGAGTLPEAADPQFPTDSGITRQMAVALCTDALTNSSTFSTCNRLLGETGVHQAIDDCVDDIRVGDYFSNLGPYSRTN